MTTQKSRGQDDLWSIDEQDNQHIIRCRHTRRGRRLIKALEITTDTGTTLVQARKSFIRKGRAKIRNASEPQLTAAYVDIQREIESLLALDPRRKNLRRWLTSITMRQRRWQALNDLTNSRDHTLTPLASADARGYDTDFVPQIFRIALLQHGDPEALRPLMSLSPTSRLRWKLLTMICEAQTATLASLHWRKDLGLNRHDRLLAVRRLCMAETMPEEWSDEDNHPAPRDCEIIQYWEGDPPPPEISREISFWREASGRTQHKLLNANQAREWILRNHTDRDANRFDHCWHPAMQADFLRILTIAKNGGVYLDCDTPHLSEEGFKRWHNLTQHCLQNNSMALCINTLAGPGYCSHYVVNCCIWSAPLHPFAQTWAEHYRQRLDHAIKTGRRSPGTIHQLGPDLISELVDDVIMSPDSRLDSVSWHGARIPRIQHQTWSLLLFDTDNYRTIFGNPFDGYCSYANCNDPRDWRVQQQEAMI